MFMKKIPNAYSLNGYQYIQCWLKIGTELKREYIGINNKLKVKYWQLVAIYIQIEPFSVGQIELYLCNIFVPPF